MKAAFLFEQVLFFHWLRNAYKNTRSRPCRRTSNGTHAVVQKLKGLGHFTFRKKNLAIDEHRRQRFGVCDFFFFFLFTFVID